MDCNKLFITGSVAWAKEHPQIGKGWGTIRARINLHKFDFTFRDKLEQVDNPIIWISTGVTYDQGRLVEKHRRLLRAFENKEYVCITNARMSHFDAVPKDTSGNPLVGAPKETRYTIECSAASIATSIRPYQNINRYEVVGIVREISPKGAMVIEAPYRGKDGIKTRKVYVINPFEFDGSLLHKKVLVFGSVCGKTPGRTDKVYAVAETIVKLE